MMLRTLSRLLNKFRRKKKGRKSAREVDKSKDRLENSKVILGEKSRSLHYYETHYYETYSRLSLEFKGNEGIKILEFENTLNTLEKFTKKVETVYNSYNSSLRKARDLANKLNEFESNENAILIGSYIETLVDIFTEFLKNYRDVKMINNSIHVSTSPLPEKFVENVRNLIDIYRELQENLILKSLRSEEAVTNVVTLKTKMKRLMEDVSQALSSILEIENVDGYYSDEFKYGTYSAKIKYRGGKAFITGLKVFVNFSVLSDEKLKKVLKIHENDTNKLILISASYLNNDEKTFKRIISAISSDKELLDTFTDVLSGFIGYEMIEEVNKILEALINNPDEFAEIIRPTLLKTLEIFLKNSRYTHLPILYQLTKFEKAGEEYILNKFTQYFLELLNKANSPLAKMNNIYEVILDSVSEEKTKKYIFETLTKFSEESFIYTEEMFKKLLAEISEIYDHSISRLAEIYQNNEIVHYNLHEIENFTRIAKENVIKAIIEYNPEVIIFRVRSDNPDKDKIVIARSYWDLTKYSNEDFSRIESVERSKEIFLLALWKYTKVVPSIELTRKEFPYLFNDSGDGSEMIYKSMDVEGGKKCKL